VQQSTKVQRELAGGHAAVKKKKGEKKMAPGVGEILLLTCSAPKKVLQWGRGRKMSILIFIAHKQSAVSETRV